MTDALPTATLFGLLFLVLAASAALALVGSWFVLWRYRRSVARAMSAIGIGARPAAPDVTAALDCDSTECTEHLRVDADALYRGAAKAPILAAACAGIAGLAYALVLASAYVLAFPVARTPLRFALTLWIHLWPVVLAAAFTAPRFVRWIAVGATAYFMPFVVGALALMLFPEPPPASVEAALQAAFDTVTPRMMLVFWLTFAGLPSGLLLLFLNPRLRAVSPLLLAFGMITMLGFVAFWFGLYTAPIKGAVLGLAGGLSSRSSAVALLVALALLGITAAAVCAWLVLGWIRRAYVEKWVSDRSLALDAFWIFFAAYFSMQFALQGPAWLLSGVLAFVAYRSTLAAVGARFHRRRGSAAGCGLTFLRVFSLGPKSNALFGALAAHWRWIGSLQLITGPDVTHSTVQPHQLLDFLSGRLASHFIGDRASLQRRLALLDRAPDRDGWYRINNFFCHADSWQGVVAELVRAGDVVLMDLRSFAAGNAGCQHELRHLIESVPLARCVFIVDRSTDLAHLRATIDAAWAALGPDSPNRNQKP
ncbi:MAG: hypothetical protein OEW22_15000, partial [Rubrivivax sp.]|nr:hypothetical protein [Rubrivivax sp.]